MPSSVATGSVYAGLAQLFRIKAGRRVYLPDFGIEGRRDSGEDQPAATPHAPNQDRNHLNQQSGEHVRNYQRPVAIHGIGPAEDELEPVRETHFGEIVSIRGYGDPRPMLSGTSASA
jgi:hypothetical protein